VPQPGEALWTDEDRAWALALLQVEADSCPDCGQPWSETSDIDNEYQYRAELHRCHACAAGAKAVSRFQKDRGDMSGLHVLITKK
jgi:hypothetical protein